MRPRYEAGQGQLLGVLVSLAVTGYAVSRLLDQLPVLVRIGIWFFGAAVVWDLLLGPALAAADRVLRRLLPRTALNAVRIPALISGVLLLLWAPLVLQRSERAYGSASGLSTAPYLERWLAVTAVLFTGSATIWAAGRVRARSRR